MRAWTPLTLAFYATLTLALTNSTQNNSINIPAGQSSLSVIAGQLTTITWTNPSSGTVTIKLQQLPITPDSGYVLQSGIPASSETASFLIPSTVNVHEYTIEIIDDTNPNNYNFSPYFFIKGATGTQTALVASTGTGSTSSTSGSTSTGSSSSSTSSASTTSSASVSSSSTESSTASAATTLQTTSAPSSGAMPLRISGRFLAAILAAAALL